MCLTQNLKNIKRGCNNIAPGLKTRVFLCFMEELLNGTLPAPEADKHLILDDIQMRVAAVGPPAVAAGKFKYFDLAEKGNKYTDNAQGEGQMTYYQPEWDLIIEGIDEDKSFSLNSMNGADMCVVAPDNEGRMIVCDTVRVTFGQMIDDSNNKYDIKIKSINKLKKTPYFYSGAVPLA